MFELSVACKYLIPRRRQLSVSIISLISIFVIALVVWLIVVFFSITDGLEKNWVNKLTALTAPLRITPTDAYYNSYYYLIDGISEASNYSHKTLTEKRNSPTTDPYDPTIDEEPPPYWAPPDLNPDGTLKDPVKIVYQTLNQMQEIQGLHAQEYELTGTRIQLQLLRPSTVIHGNNLYGGTTQSTLTYPAYLGNFEGDNPSLDRILLPINTRDINHFLFLLGTSNRELIDENNGNNQESSPFNPTILQKRIKNFFNFVSIKKLETPSSGWNIPRFLLPPLETQWDVCAILKENQVIRLVVPQERKNIHLLQKKLEEQGIIAVEAQAFIQNGIVSILIEHQNSLQKLNHPLFTLAPGISFLATLDPTSIETAREIEDLRFAVTLPIQETILSGKVPYRNLEIADVAIHPSLNQNESPLWVNRSLNSEGKTFYHLPTDPDIGEGVLLPKSFRDVGVMIGDRGTLSYLSPTTSTLQEQQIAIYVAGFYDPGIIPIGGKFILAGQGLTSIIRASHQSEDQGAITNGINVRLTHLEQAENVKRRLIEAFKNEGISRYWNVETYREYEFTKEIMGELQSQKNIFLLIAVVIILVACSNIISMLVILVNDKKLEIGILRSMGATSGSIALIFGLSGALIGVFGSIIGISGAIMTLQNLNFLIKILSNLQGRDLFNANFYGQTLPSDLSVEALSFVLIATVCMSLLAGIVPAIKACLLKPSHILRSAGG